MVYLTDREAGRAALIPTTATLSSGPVFGVIGHWLPSFVHPFAFSLFSAAASRFRRPVLGACATWWIVNVAFEVGQHPRISVPIAEWLIGTFGDGGMAQRLARYFLLGTFDAGDIAAATLGASAGAGVLLLLDRLESRHAR